MNGLKTLRDRLLALGFVALAGLLAAGGFGLLQLYRLDRGVGDDLARLQRTVAIGLDVQNASIDFKTQVQEWKNILIRGNDVEQFQRYSKSFGKHAQDVSSRAGHRRPTAGGRIAARRRGESPCRRARCDARALRHRTEGLRRRRSRIRQEGRPRGEGHRPQRDRSDDRTDPADRTGREGAG
ncbi:hypothetical protein [Methyloversatilis discipulorum]|uniref:hypothetical protein n=1 Tax=Methyloversatilis discipulorum TaxID=1119528 RepID=UPI003137C9BD